MRCCNSKENFWENVNLLLNSSLQEQVHFYNSSAIGSKKYNFRFHGRAAKLNSRSTDAHPLSPCYCNSSSGRFWSDKAQFNYLLLKNATLHCTFIRDAFLHYLPLLLLYSILYFFSGYFLSSSFCKNSSPCGVNAVIIKIVRVVFTKIDKWLNDINTNLDLLFFELIIKLNF